MKALTIWQPWASLIIAGVKPYEFRGWKAPASIVGQRIAIHAGARPPKSREIAGIISGLRSSQPWLTGLRLDALDLLLEWHRNPEGLWLSSVLGQVTLGTPRSGSEVAADLGGPVNDSDRDEHSNWAWPMLDVTAQAPEPARGAQGFWNWERIA